MTHLLRMRVCCPKTYYQLTYMPITAKQLNMKLIMTEEVFNAKSFTHIINISESESDLSFLVFADDDLPKTWENLCPPDTHVCTGHGPHHATHWTWHRHLLRSKNLYLFILIRVRVHCSHIIQHEKLTVAHANDQMRYFPTSGYSTRFRSCLVKAVKLIKNSWPTNMLSVEDN